MKIPFYLLFSFIISVFANNTAAAQITDSTANNKQLEKIKSDFKYQKSDFDSIGWYTHKSQQDFKLTAINYLRVLVNTNGYAYLQDQYFGNDWVFHTSIQVKIGDKIYSSKIIDSSDKNNYRKIFVSTVLEQISYVNESDNGIIKAIAENYNQDIKIRFSGDGTYSEFILSSRDKKAIQESYLLSNLLKKAGN